MYKVYTFSAVKLKFLTSAALERFKILIIIKLIKSMRTKLEKIY